MKKVNNWIKETIWTESFFCSYHEKKFSSHEMTLSRLYQDWLLLVARGGRSEAPFSWASKPCWISCLDWVLSTWPGPSKSTCMALVDFLLSLFIFSSFFPSAPLLCFWVIAPNFFRDFFSFALQIYVNQQAVGNNSKNSSSASEIEKRKIIILSIDFFFRFSGSTAVHGCLAMIELLIDYFSKRR